MGKKKERIEPPYWEVGLQIKLPEGVAANFVVPDDVVEISSIIKKMLSDYYPKGTKIRIYDCHEEVEEEPDDDFGQEEDETEAD